MIQNISDEYVYKKEVDWSLFNYGFAIPIEHQVVFSQVAGHSERVLEAQFNFDVQDDTAGFRETEQIVKIRKLNKKIGDNLKRLYGYRCQICGRLIGEEYGAHVAEAHHIGYFVKSLNNDASNQIIVCPNHHSIIHDVDPEFDRRRLLFRYSNGFEEKVVLNQHL